MAITPNTELRIIKLPIELDDKNQLTFTSEEEQYNYFSSLPYLDEINFTYQRQDSIIRYPRNIDSILEYNYVMYQNKNYTNKWFYAYITDMQYVNDNLTYITIKTDVFQTWQFSIDFLDSFIEREHILNDTIGANTVPENVETGEYISNGNGKFGLGTCHAVIALTEDIMDESSGVHYHYQDINGVPTGLFYYVVGDFTSVNFIAVVTAEVENRKDPSLIQAIFMVPDKLTGYDQFNRDYWSFAIGDNLKYAPYHKLSDLPKEAIEMDTTAITKHYSQINGYTPKNNKLYTYPYNYLMVDNNGGSVYEYMYENFNTETCNFKTYGSITPGCSIRTIPQNYKGVENNNSEGINSIKLPIGSWSTDPYINWLTQNGVNIGVGMISSGVQLVGGIGMAAAGLEPSGASNILNGALGIASSIGQIYEHSHMPMQVDGNINSGDITYSTKNYEYTYYNRSIKKEYAEIIDNYFSMYGYKTNRVKKPNLNTRPNWNFIKTIGANIHSLFPTKDLEEIKELFNSGITLWHNPSTFLDYSQPNK